MAHLEVEDGRRIYFEHHAGEKQPVVLVHGWGVTARAWDTIAPALRADGHEVVLLDSRTHGRSDNDFVDVSIAAMGSDVARLCEHLGLQRPVVNGWSLGGAVAVDAVARLGANAGGLVLTGGATPRYTAAPDWPHGGTVDDVEAVLAGAAADRATTFKGVAQAVCAVPVSTEVIDWMWGMFMEMGPRGDEAIRDLAGLDQRKTISTLEVPVLLLHGRNDGFVAFSGAEAAVDLYPDARLVPFDASGHAPHLEERDAYLAELRTFLASTGR
ncbi:pimeloyl-ACP methyl ester carboxylesterase [Actinomycetospora succinea]|uniref:Pimeloyl-ACP methyl ester carboxylesterase n=1 Tax=Actinomycetospora succinea TaxID=663603 RepID=A0A4R6VD51_9PSEU|nr:alpha/beta hydrolase [Actinomycetospora succinea]TDQ58290.1 pimeloyl-ACP methyl ester carboxylesterase [Actinomycetospora succinea]